MEQISNSIKATAYKSYKEYLISYNDDKAEQQHLIQLLHERIALLTIELYALERKRKSKHKQDNIDKKQREINYETERIEVCETKIFMLEMENMRRVEKLKNSGEVEFKIVEQGDPNMTYYTITEKAKLPIKEHTE
jgi:hypothetical protein